MRPPVATVLGVVLAATALGPSLGLTNATAGEARSTASARVYGTVYYEDLDGFAKPAKRARVQLYDADTYSRDDHIATTWADDSGYFSITFTNDVDGGLEGSRRCDCYVKVQSLNGAIGKVQTPYAAASHEKKSPVRTNLGDGTSNLGSITADSGEARHALRIFDGIVTAWLYIRAQAGISVPPVTVTYPCLAINCPVGRPYFDPFLTHEIYLRSSASRDTVIHEYGHFVMWKAYGEWWPVPASVQADPAGCALYHEIDKFCDRRIGWSEGWATFLSMAAQNDQNHNNWRLESEDVPSFQAGAVADGVEGRVAASLWDLLDATPDRTDEYPAVAFVEIFETLWKGARHRTLREYYDDYRARGHPFAAFNAAVFASGIGWNVSPRVTSVSGSAQSITAVASDDRLGHTDGYIRRVTFEYSTDGASWTRLGALEFAFPGGAPPYVHPWNPAALGLSGRSVWVRAIAMDNLGFSSGWRAAGPFVVSSASSRVRRA